MTDNPHGGHHVHPCPPHVGGRTVPQIVKPQVGDASPPCGPLKRRADAANGLPIAQKDTILVKIPHFIPIAEDICQFGRQCSGSGNGDDRGLLAGMTAPILRESGRKGVPGDRESAEGEPRRTMR